MTIAEWIALLTAAWLAATVSGAAGFGGALLLLPVLVHAVGAKDAIPILTIAQLAGNLSRAWLGWRTIRWRPALSFCAGAVPAALVGARLFVSLPSAWLLRAVGVFLLAALGPIQCSKRRRMDARLRKMEIPTTS